MKKLFSICLALVLFLVPMSQALAVSFLPYQTCPACGTGTIGVYCSENIRDKPTEVEVVFETHELQLTPTKVQVCNVQKHYYATIYQCTDCKAYQSGPAHLEWIYHSYCPVQTCCPF